MEDAAEVGIYFNQGSDEEEKGMDVKGLPRRMAITEDLNLYPSELVSYADLIIREGRVVKDRHGIAGNREASPDEIESCKELEPGEARDLVARVHWRNVPPEEGTRRFTILEAILEADVLSYTEAREIADDVEESLRRQPDARVRTFAITQRDSHRGLRESDPSFAEYHRGAEVAYEIVADRLDPDLPGELRDNPHLPEELKKKLERELLDAGWTGTEPAEGTRRALIRDAIKAHWDSDPAVSGDASQNALRIADAVETALLRWTIDAEAEEEAVERATPGQDRSDGWVQQLVMEAFTRAQDCDVPFPADDLDELLVEYGVRPQRPRTWPSRGSGAKIEGATKEGPEGGAMANAVREVFDEAGGDDPAATIKFLEGEVERLLAGREEARSGEDHWKHQRDAALRLLLWVIGDLLPVDKR